jgi:copper chaperone
MTSSTDHLTYSVPGASCAHCVASIEAEVGKVDGVDSVAVDLGTKRVSVTGSELNADRVVDAIGEAGYDAERV